MNRAQNRAPLRLTPGATARQYLLVRSPEGTAELLADGVQLWASDTDPDLLDELGTVALRDDDIGDVLDYLVESGYLSDDEADECAVESEDDDDEDDDVLDDEDDDDEDDELEDE